MIRTEQEKDDPLAIAERVVTTIVSSIERMQSTVSRSATCVNLALMQVINVIAQDEFAIELLSERDIEMVFEKWMDENEERFSVKYGLEWRAHLQISAHERYGIGWRRAILRSAARRLL